MKKLLYLAMVALLSACIWSGCSGGDDTNNTDGDSEKFYGGDDNENVDGGIDGDTDDPVEDGDQVEQDGDRAEDEEDQLLDLSIGLMEGETRAGLITSEEELIGGPMANGKIGDYKIYNSQIRVILESTRISDGWGSLGGTIADADIVRSDSESGQSLFSEYFFCFGLRLQDPKKVKVINDGSNGEASVVRFTGPDVNLPVFDEGFAGIFTSTPLNTEITVDYVLPPDSNVLEIHSSFEWTGDKNQYLNQIMQVFIMGDGLKNFRVGSGYDKTGHGGGSDIYISASDKVSYGFLNGDTKEATSQFSQLYSYEGLNIYTEDKAMVNPGKKISFVRYVAVTSGGVNPILDVLNKMKGVEGLGKITGRVLAADGSTLPGAHVHVIDKNAVEKKDYANQATASEEGTYELSLPPGDYEFIPFVDGFGLMDGTSVTITSGSNESMDLTIPEAAILEFDVTDKNGTSLPCKIFADRIDGHIIPPDSFGEFVWHDGHQQVVHSESGSGSIMLPAGEYSVTASRGFEYSMDISNLTLTAGKTTTFTGIIEHVVDTTGFISSDFHIHSKASPDSDVYYKDRIRSAISEGVEVPISTDHDVVVDWTPAAIELAVTDWVHPIVGIEITTFTYGHFNVWPMVMDPTLPNNGSFNWCYKSAPELFEEIREYETDPILHVCHPRMAGSGYFISVGYDAETGEVEKVDNWSDNFDTIEIINGGDINTAISKTLPDWYSFLNRGYRFAGVSGSDTHKLTHEVGNVRNWVASDSDKPNELDPFKMRDNVRVQKLIVSTGPYVEFNIGAAGLGEDITDTDGSVDLKVKVQAPLYMEVTRLTVIGNGEIVKELDISAMADTDNPVIRYDDIITVTPAVDTWYIIIVEGDNDSFPVNSKRAFAFTNPIYVDVDGNSEFDAIVVD